jgi:phenylacetate-CoA ligase
MEKRRVSRFLYLNEKTDTLSWAPSHMDRMIKELAIYKPAVLEANPSYLAKLCRYIATSKRTVFQPELIIFTYEYPTKIHYRQIRRVFDVPLVSSYGTTEVGYVFMECEAGKFHQNSDFCRVDFQPLKPEHGGPALGRLLVTTFNNPWYILVRFDVGDLARLDDEDVCSCGRSSGLMLSAMEGRTGNVTLTCNGKLVTLRELDNALSVLEDIDEYRLEQMNSDSYSLQLVTHHADKNQLQEKAMNVLYALYGKDAKISIVFKNAIAPLASGKYSISQTLFPIRIEDYLDERYIFKKKQNNQLGID